MTDETSRDRILKAVKRRLKESDERDRVRLITDIVGDRRDRDLVDVIAQIEQDEGWSSALEYLLKVRGQKYSSPITMGNNETNLEELKYREVVFALLSCSGLEPVPIDTTVLLEELDSEKSLLDASRVLISKLENLAIDQIRDGDTLFFDFSGNISISQETTNLLRRIRNEKIHDISLHRDGSTINIDSLWRCELGRLALADLGIKGTQVIPDTLSRVLSVIQEPISLLNDLNVPSTSDDRHVGPSNNEYSKLLTQIIQQDIDGLGRLASRHALPTLNALLDESISQYKDSQSTASFKTILQYINAHIAVRAIDSVIVLEKASKMTDTRVSTMAIIAIGNFYHESAVSTLVDILCTNKKREIIDTTTRSIRTVHKRCPEADHVLDIRLNRECTNRGKLLKLQRLLLKERGLYYQ
ncbi:MAG: hypothetical protein ACW98U_08675 [Candidatus Thorarchaeota archaeon]